MKSKEELFNMPIVELREYMNSLSIRKYRKLQRYLRKMILRETHLNFLQRRSFLII